MPIVASIVVVVLILCLEFLSWERREGTSKALWIPFLWLLLAGSRSVSSWSGAPSDMTLEQRYSEGTPLDAAIFAVLILCGVLILNRRSRQMAAFFRGNAALLLYLGYCAASLIWSESPLVALKHWVKLVGDVVMALIVLTEVDPQAAIRNLLTRAALILLPLSVLLILAFPELGSALDPALHKMFYNGVTTQKNELGMTSLVFALGALWALQGDYEDRLRTGRQRRLFVQGVIFVTALWLLIKSDSMTSFSCFTLTAIIMISITRPWVGRRLSTMHCLVGGAIGLALFALFLDSSGTLLRMLGRNPTLTGRTEIWKAVLAFQTNPLFGTGFDSFWLSPRIRGVADRIGYIGITEAHNGYLEIYINLGWIGVGLLLWLMASGYLRALAVLRTHPHMGRFRVAFVTVSIMFNLSEAGFKQRSPIWIAFLLATIDFPNLLPAPVGRQLAEFHAMLPAAKEKMRMLH